MVDDFRKLTCSSFDEIISDNPTFLCRNEIFTLFGGKEQFIISLKEYGEEFI